GEHDQLRHTRESGHPGGAAEWIPAFAGMTNGPKRETSRVSARRVRANAATAYAASLDAAIAARDADALPALYAEVAEFAEHPTGVVYDRQGMFYGWRSLLSARDPAYLQEPLAALGDALALCRVSWSASAFAGGKFDVGAYKGDCIDLIEVDEQGRCR